MQAIKVKELSNKFREVRSFKRITLGAVAKQTGLSIATLSRLENEADLKEVRFEPSIKTVMALAIWLDEPINTFLYAEEKNETLEIADHLREVEMHLRANKDLDEKSTQALTNIMALALKQVTSTKADEDEKN